MEILKLYSIQDKKADRHDTPFFAISDLFAKRRFIMMLDEKSILSKFKDDFTLLKIGKFNITTGELIQEIDIIVEGKDIET